VLSVLLQWKELEMNLNRLAISCAAPIALGFGVLAAPAEAQTATASAAFERAMLQEMDAPTRASIEQRATGGNTVAAVIGTTLLNNYYGAGARNPGAALTVIAVDFARGVAVLGNNSETFQIIQFDPKTLQLKR